MDSALLLSLLLLGSLAIGLAATDPADSEDTAGDLPSKEDIVNFLGTVPLFNDLSNDQLSQIADIVELKYYQAGANIENEESTGRNFETNTFVVYDGNVNIAQTSMHGRSGDVTKLGPGDYFVQKAHANRGASTTSMHALTDVKALSLNMNDLKAIVGDQIVLDEAA